MEVQFKSFAPADYDQALGLKDGTFNVSGRGLEIEAEPFAVPPTYDAPDWVNHYQNFWLLRRVHKIPVGAEIVFRCSLSSRQTFPESSVADHRRSPLSSEVLRCVANIREDIRFCAGSFQVIDPGTGLFYGFSQSDHALLAVHGALDSFPALGWTSEGSNLNFAAWRSTALSSDKKSFSTFAAQRGQTVAVTSDSWSQASPEVLRLWEEWLETSGHASTARSQGRNVEGAVPGERYVERSEGKAPPRCYYPRANPWAGKKASFVAAVEVARREGASPLAQFDDVEVAFRTTSSSSGIVQTVHFRLRGEEVFRVLQPGRRPAEKFRILDHGGYAADLVTSGVVAGFGITSLLDCSRPNNYGRKNFQADYRIKTGIVQLAHFHRYYEVHHNHYGELINVDPLGAFALNYRSNENGMRAALFGQGCAMRVKAFSIEIRPFPAARLSRELPAEVEDGTALSEEGTESSFLGRLGPPAESVLDKRGAQLEKGAAEAKQTFLSGLPRLLASPDVSKLDDPAPKRLGASRPGRLRPTAAYEVRSAPAGPESEASFAGATSHSEDESEQTDEALYSPGQGQ